MSGGITGYDTGIDGISEKVDEKDSMRFHPESILYNFESFVM